MFGKAPSRKQPGEQMSGQTDLRRFFLSVLLLIALAAWLTSTVPLFSGSAMRDIVAKTALPQRRQPLPPYSQISSGPLPLSALAYQSVQGTLGDDARAPEDADPEACPGGRIKKSEARFENYLVRIYRHPAMDPEGCYEILKKGKRIDWELALAPQIGGSPELPLVNKEKLLVQVGTDVTGLGRPNLVVGDWSGGAHCCFDFYVFEIGDKFRHVATIEAEDSGGAYFADVDRDGRYEFVANDWTFAYWHASFGESPAPGIILRFRGNAFHLATDLMRNPPQPAGKLKALARRVREDRGWENPQDPPSALWGVMLGLIYTGNADQAWKFFAMAWQPERKSKREFLAEFRAQLKSSPYFRDLKELNGGPLW
jgi:hypothetical protein